MPIYMHKKFLYYQQNMQKSIRVLNGKVKWFAIKKRKNVFEKKSKNVNNVNNIIISIVVKIVLNDK
jgi:hypothetical protein